jgi:hypothetical protein
MAGGGRGGGDFDRIEGDAGQARRITTFLPSFRNLLTPLHMIVKP